MQWVESKLKILEEKALKAENVYDKNNFEAFKREVTQNFKTLVAIDVKESIRLVNERFAGNHKDIIDQLAREPTE